MDTFFSNKLLFNNLTNGLIKLYFVNHFNDNKTKSEQILEAERKTKQFLEEFKYIPKENLIEIMEYDIDQWLETIGSTCPICMENNNTTSIVFECKHKFHKECYIEHRSFSGNIYDKCPMCRLKFNNDEYSPGKITSYNFKNNELLKHPSIRFLTLFKPIEFSDLISLYKDENVLLNAAIELHKALTNQV